MLSEDVGYLYDNQGLRADRHNVEGKEEASYWKDVPGWPRDVEAIQGKLSILNEGTKLIMIAGILCTCRIIVN